MNCPYCGFGDSKVTDSRAADDGVRRRRQCLSCGERFTTYERVQLNDLLVVKRDGRREDFDREKLIGGLRPACHRRPIPAGVVEAIADEVEARVRADGRPEVESRVIGELVMARLREVDEIAYIRFASVYRRFEDIEDMKREVAALEARTAVPPPQLPLISDAELAHLSGRDADLPARRGRGPRKRQTA